tara:strand:- start:332 stop:997 length:666 start_codon:yes stop_codon:yes gene_type:complete
MTDIIDILKNNEVFKELESSDLEMVAALTVTKTVPKNTFLINEGDDSTPLYIIKSGKVNVTLSNENGKAIILGTLCQGDHFGEIGLLDDKPRSANIITLEKCELIVLHKTGFYDLLINNSMISIGIIRYLCRRIRLITNSVHGLALLDVYGRLVKLLTDLSVSEESGTRVIKTPLTHRDIAMRIGSSREMISRIFSELEKGGYLSVSNRIITIKKKLPPAW